MKIPFLKKYKQPEYIEENRCKPCTILNVLIAAMSSFVVARRSRIVGIVSFGLSLVLIYVRGYLVPGTPTLTKMYLPSEVLQWFGKEYESNHISRGFNNGAKAGTSIANNDSTISEQIDAEQYFLELDILELCKNASDLCLTDEFSNDLSNEIEKIDREKISL